MTVERACAAGGDPLTLRVRLVEAWRAVVPFDWYVFVLTDPVTTVGVAPLADVPPSMMPELPRLIRLKYATAVNRWTGLTSAARLDEDQRAHSPLYRDLLGPAGIGDVASMVFRDRYGCWAFLDLWRAGADARFTDRDLAALNAGAATATTALRGSVARTLTAPDTGHERVDPLVLLLDEALTIVGTTPRTHEYLSVLVPPRPGTSPVPACAFNLAAQLLADDGHPATARVHLHRGSWLSVRASAIDGPAALTVTLQQCPANERMDLFARAHGLSPRESELLGHLAAGQDTNQIAAAMLLSAHTVQDHLKSIFTKTGAGSRRGLLSTALGRSKRSRPPVSDCGRSVRSSGERPPPATAMIPGDDHAVR